MRRVRLLVASLAVSMSLLFGTAATAGAYGGGADHDMWQVGVSFNCNNPDFCGPSLGGFWAWLEFDRSVDGTVTWGDVQGAGCSHTLGGGGFNGAVHVSVEIESWTIEPGSAGPQTFFASGEETDSFRGDKVTFDISHFDTGVPAVAGHYSTNEILGFDAPPGVAFQIQVAFRPAK
jgi:hypothetical protein